MNTRRILLRKITHDDLKKLFEWRNTEKYRFLFHYNESIIDFEEFCKEFYSDMSYIKFRYIIQKLDSKELIGIAFAHSFSKKELRCYINIYLVDRLEKKGYGVDAFALLYNHLFESVGVKKIYVQALPYNRHSISCIEASGMSKVKNGMGKRTHLSKEYNLIRFVGNKNVLPRIKGILQALSCFK